MKKCYRSIPLLIKGPKVVLQLVLIILAGTQLLMAKTIKLESLQDVRVNLDVKSESLKKTLNSIQHKSNMKFFYNEQLVSSYNDITIKAENETVSNVLDKILSNTELSYLDRKGKIIIVEKEVHKVPKSVESSVIKQDKVITGNVQDDGGPMAGVSVRLKNSTGVSTVTDQQGNFALRVPDAAVAGNALIFSFIGYQTQEIALGDKSVITVKLVADNRNLDEIVVVGYGTQKKSDVTGSVASLKPEDFNKGVVTNPQQLLQGKISGVSVTAASGKPGGASTIRIRGGTSITAGNDPLYVIDGVPLQLSNAGRQANIGTTALNVFNQEPVNPLNSINPADIASIEILKDASATAIYGSRGANGVVIITTKKGTLGSVVTSYDTYVGISKVAKTLDVLTGDQYRQFMKDNNIANFTDRGQNTNWQDQIFRSAISQNHNLSLSGGAENSTYRGSFGYVSQQGVIKSSGIKNYTGRINVSHKALKNRLSIDMNLSGALIDEDNAAVSGDLSGEGGNILKDALRFNPTYPVYEANGDFAQINQFVINPLSYTRQLEDFRTTKRNLGNISTTYKILDPLSINVNMGYTSEDIDAKAYIPRSNPLGQGLGGVAILQGSKHWSKLLETTLMFNKDFNSDNHLNAIAGYSFQDFTDQGFRNRVSNFISDEFKYDNIGAAITRDVISSYKEVSRLISFYARVNYNLMDKYLLTATVRRDGSSRFGTNNKWGVFPSGSLAWRISKEDFFGKNGFVNDLKFRVSYGVTGNQEIGNLLSQPTLSATSNNYIVGGNQVIIVSPERYENPNLEWESTSQFNVGSDFQFLNNRIYGSVDYYRKTTNQLLLSFAIPSPSVVSTQVANVGKVENKGIELSLGANVIQSNDFNWKADFNISRNVNKVISLSNDQYSTQIIFTAAAAGFGITGVNTQAIIPGQPLGTFYGPKFIGTTNGVQQFEDINGNGSFSVTNDIAPIGNTQPDFTVGLNNTFSYKRFDLSFMFRGVFGNDVFNNTAMDMRRTSLLPGQNVLASALGDETAYGQPVIFSSKWIESGSFIRLDNLTLGFNPKIDKATALRNLRFYFTGQNLFIITNYSGLDPELTSGREYMSYPRSRTYLIGASITF
jgi:TonB-linked SusC/RagA family outer membrane protein